MCFYEEQHDDGANVPFTPINMPPHCLVSTVVSRILHPPSIEFHISVLAFLAGGIFLFPGLPP